MIAAVELVMMMWYGGGGGDHDDSDDYDDDVVEKAGQFITCFWKNDWRWTGLSKSLRLKWRGRLKTPRRQANT